MKYIFEEMLRLNLVYIQKQKKCLADPKEPENWKSAKLTNFANRLGRTAELLAKQTGVQTRSLYTRP